MELSEKNIVECLEASGCSKDTIQDVLRCVCKDDYQAKMLILRKHRCHLLEKLHVIQKQIDCLDYFIYQLKKEK